MDVSPKAVTYGNRLYRTVGFEQYVKQRTHLCPRVAGRCYGVGRIDLTIVPETDRTASVVIKSLYSESGRIAKSYRHPRNEVLADYYLENDVLQHEHVAESGSMHRLDVD
jgi:hypothetical protein